MSEDKYIIVPYKQIWFSLKKNWILNSITILIISLLATFFFEKFKKYEASASLEQVTQSSGNDSFGKLPIGVGNLLSNNQLSSKSTSFYLKAIHSYDFFIELSSKDSNDFFIRDIFENQEDEIKKFEIYRNNLKASIDDFGFIDLNFKCNDWSYCEEFLAFLIEQSNNYVKTTYKSRAEVNLESIMQQINKTTNISISNILLKEVADELIIKARSESDKGYVFPVIKKPFSDRQPIVGSMIFFLIIYVMCFSIYLVFVFVINTVKAQLD